MFNIYNNDDYNKDNYNTIFINFVNNNHFNYLKPIVKANGDKDIMNTIERLFKINLLELTNIRKKIFLFVQNG